MNIAITGASGNIGGMVARHLNTRGLPLILPLRNPTKAPDLPNCEARRFAYGDLELAKQALNGWTCCLWCPPPRARRASRSI